MKRLLPSLIFFAAVVIAAISALVFVNGRKAIAVANAEQAIAEKKRASSEAQAAKDRAAAEKLQQETAVAHRVLATQQAAERKAELELEKAANSNNVLKVRAAELQALAQRDQAKAAADLKVKSENELKAAQALKSAEEAKAQTATREAEKAQALKAAKEDEALKIKFSLNELEQLKSEYDNLMAEARDMKHELEEQLRATQPEMTVNDLAIASSDDSPVVKTVKSSDPFETDADRELTKLNELRREAAEARAQSTRGEITSALEKLFKDALREQRPLDAKYYYQTLKTLYPDWKPES